MGTESNVEIEQLCAILAEIVARELSRDDVAPAEKTLPTESADRILATA